MYLHICIILTLPKIVISFTGKIYKNILIAILEL